MRLIAAAFLFAVLPTFTVAQAADNGVGIADLSASARFAAEAKRICVNLRADPAAVKRLAEAEGWSVEDPAAAPGKSPTYIFNGKAYTRTNVWSIPHGPATYWVGLFDIPGQPAVRDCSLIAWDLDFDAVDSAVRGGKSTPNGTSRDLPVRMYRLPNQDMVTYSWSGIGTKRLHVISVTPKS
ncbi:MAG: hypothetical protein KKA44_15540 [Alphaproteobacteria bacterium]|nr:hypothetical protein [Alphaproteobacteria bacterium]MBU0866492.1 hypothetical protein [Alphaproteobacteria bacterium]MBU1826369.1 hypothetical protein [Alphaproteobacteria bacterium]